MFSYFSFGLSHACGLIYTPEAFFSQNAQVLTPQ